jgi:hypothetical protein
VGSRNFRHRYPITGFEVSEVSEVSEGRLQTPVGLVVGVSAVSASDPPIANSSARRPDPCVCEYFRTGIGSQKRVCASFRRFPPLRDTVSRARLSGGFEVSALCALSAAHFAVGFRNFRIFRYRIG